MGKVGRVKMGPGPEELWFPGWKFRLNLLNDLRNDESLEICKQDSDTANTGKQGKGLHSRVSQPEG